VTKPVGLTEREIAAAKSGTAKMLFAIKRGWKVLPPPWWTFD